MWVPRFPSVGTLAFGDLAAARSRFLARGELAPGVRAPVAESWRRSLAHGIDPGRLVPQAPDPEDLERALEAHRQLVDAAAPLLVEADQLLTDLPHLLVLAGPDARVLRIWAQGLPARGRDEANMFEGATWAESAIGCNGVGTALAAGEPVALIGPEHFQETYLDWTCVGMPLRSPDGTLAGAIDLSVPNEAVSVTTWGWMLSLACWIEHELATPAPAVNHPVAPSLTGDPFAALRGALDLLGSEVELGTHRRLLSDAARQVSRVETHFERRISALRTELDLSHEAHALLLHEIRGSLGTIVNAAMLIEKEEATEVREEIRLLRGQVHVLTRLAEDFQHLERMVRTEALDPELLDLRDSVAEATDLFRSEMDARGYSLVLKLPSEPLPVYGDRVRLQQVFVNLLSNAAKYGDPGDRTTVTAIREGNEGLVRVADDGQASRRGSSRGSSSSSGGSSRERLPAPASGSPWCAGLSSSTTGRYRPPVRGRAGGASSPFDCRSPSTRTVRWTAAYPRSSARKAASSAAGLPRKTRSKLRSRWPRRTRSVTRRSMLRSPWRRARKSIRP